MYRFAVAGAMGLPVSTMRVPAALVTTWRLLALSWATASSMSSGVSEA